MMNKLRIVFPYFITVIFNVLYSFVSFFVVISYFMTSLDDLNLISNEDIRSIRLSSLFLIIIVFSLMMVINILLSKFLKRYNYKPVLYWIFTLIISLIPYIYFIYWQIIILIF